MFYGVKWCWIFVYTFRGLRVILSPNIPISRFFPGTTVDGRRRYMGITYIIHYAYVPPLTRVWGYDDPLHIYCILVVHGRHVNTSPRYLHRRCCHYPWNINRTFSCPHCCSSSATRLLNTWLSSLWISSTMPKPLKYLIRNTLPITLFYMPKTLRG